MPGLVIGIPAVVRSLPGLACKHVYPVATGSSGNERYNSDFLTGNRLASCIPQLVRDIVSHLGGNGITLQERNDSINRNDGCGATSQSIRFAQVRGIAKYRWPEEVACIRPPGLLVPASVDQTKAWALKVAIMAHTRPMEVEESSHTTSIRIILSRRLDGFRWAVSEMLVDDNGLEIARALIQGAAIAISGGSFKDSQGASAFSIKEHFKHGRHVGRERYSW